MSTRRLARIPSLDPRLVLQLSNQSILTVADLFRYNPIILMEICDCSYQDAIKLYQQVSGSIVIEPITAYSMLINHRNNSSIIRLSESIDSLSLSRGVSELVGSSGMGKTQCCLTTAVLATLPIEYSGLNGGVIYIDTEGTFNPERLIEIGINRYPELFQSITAKRKLAESVIIYTEKTSKSLLTRLSSLEEIIIERNIKLLILDGIAAPIRFNYHRSNNNNSSSNSNTNNLIERQNILTSIANQLKFISETFNIPVLVTNQITTRITNNTNNSNNTNTTITTLGAALGPAWAHAVNSRFNLFPSNEPNTAGLDLKIIQIAKSPQYPALKYYYRITSAGIEIQSESINSSDNLDINIDSESNLNVLEMSLGSGNNNSNFNMDYSINNNSLLSSAAAAAVAVEELFAEELLLQSTDLLQNSSNIINNQTVDPVAETEIIDDSINIDSFPELPAAINYSSKV